MSSKLALAAFLTLHRNTASLDVVPSPSIFAFVTPILSFYSSDSLCNELLQKHPPPSFLHHHHPSPTITNHLALSCIFILVCAALLYPKPLCRFVWCLPTVCLVSLVCKALPFFALLFLFYSFLLRPLNFTPSNSLCFWTLAHYQDPLAAFIYYHSSYFYLPFACHLPVLILTASKPLSLPSAYFALQPPFDRTQCLPSFTPGPHLLFSPSSFLVAVTTSRNILVSHTASLHHPKLCSPT